MASSFRSPRHKAASIQPLLPDGIYSNLLEGRFMAEIVVGLVLCTFAGFFGLVKTTREQSVFASAIVYAILGFIGTLVGLYIAMPLYGSQYMLIALPFAALVIAILSGVVGAFGTRLSMKGKKDHAFTLRLCWLILVGALIVSFGRSG